MGAAFSREYVDKSSWIARLLDPWEKVAKARGIHGYIRPPAPEARKRESECAQAACPSDHAHPTCVGDIVAVQQTVAESPGGEWDFALCSRCIAARIPEARTRGRRETNREFRVPIVESVSKVLRSL